MKLSDNEIIKALECCVKTEFISGCAECEMFAFDCKDKLIEYALDLINRLKAEKEKCESQMKLLEAFLNDYKLAYEKAKAEIERYQDIESTIDEFWTGLEKLSMFKGKEKPTLEELLEYIEQKEEEIRRLQKDKADIISAVEYRINQAKEFAYKEFAERLCEGRVSNDSVVIAVKAELKAITDTLTKLPHNSLCETETYEGVTDTNVGGKMNDFKE